MKITKLLYLASILFLIFCSACAVRKAATAVTADIASRGMVAVETEEDIFVAKESVLPLIKVMEVLQQGDPDNKTFKALLAKSYGNYAFGFAEVEYIKDPKNSDVAERIKRFYGKGKDSGLVALSKNKKPISDLSQKDFDKLIGKMGKKDVEKLFWTAFDWGSYINLSRDDISAVADLPRVEQMVDRVIAVQPDFQCGIAYAFKGVFIAGNPLRGDPKKSKDDFEKAIGFCNGNYLMNKVLYAEWYAKTVGDTKLFKDTLNDVISADASLLPRFRLANEIAKERAKALLDNNK